MQLDELKKSMSLLDQLLSKTNTDIKINVAASETAQNKILKKYRKGFTSTAILAVVFTAMWIGDVNSVAFPDYLCAYLIIYLSVATLWYIFLYVRFKRVNVAQLAPRIVFAESTRIKIYTISGEAVSVICLAVFFTLFLPDLMAVNPFAFWLCVATLVCGLISTGIYFLPRYIRLFNELNTIKE